MAYDPIALGNKLYLIRKHKGKSQAEVAAEAEISERTYSEIERGKTDPHFSTIIQICTVLEIPMEDLLLDEKEIQSKWRERLFRRVATYEETLQKHLFHVMDALMNSFDTIEAQKKK